MGSSFAQAPAQSALIDGLVQYLGVEPNQRQAVRDGETVVAGLPGLEASEEAISAGGAFLLVAGVSARDLVEAFLQTGTFEQIHDVTRDDAVTPASAQSFADRFSTFEIDLREEPRAIVGAPGDYLNLDPQELDYIRSLDPDAPDFDRQLTLAMRRVLSERLADYVAEGLDAGRIYVRGRDSVSPTDQLRSALSGMAALQGPFGPFVEAIMTAPADEAAADTHRLHWVEKMADDRRVVALADQVRYFDEDHALAAELHYYVSGTYDALVTVVGATPVEDRTLLFAISHTFTDRVAGVGAGLRHRVARRMVSEGLAAHLERVREHVLNDR